MAYKRRIIVGMVMAAFYHLTQNLDVWKPFNTCGGTRYTPYVGQFFNFNFVGTGIYVVGTVSYAGGIMTFNLDGVTSTFNRYKVSVFQCGVPLFGKAGLGNTSHTLTATLSGPSPENTTAYPYLQYQYILYTVLDSSDSATALSATSTSGTATSSASASPATTSSKTNIGAIAGGAAAGAVGLLIIGIVIGLCIRRGKDEKSTTITTQQNLVPTRQNFIDSSAGTAGFGRFSPDGDQRRSMGPARDGASWSPDPEMASILTPQSNSPVMQYPFGPAAPSVVQSFSQLSRSSPGQTNTTGIPHSPTSDYAVQNPTPETEASLLGTAQLPASDVERIAARVASIINQPSQLPPGARPPESSSPPPMQSIVESCEKPPIYE